jgi:hypothetical protein
MAAMSVAEQLASVKLQLDAVNTKIDKVEMKLEADNLSDDDKKYWRDEKKQLREEKKQLRDKENKLLDEKMFWMKQQQQQQQQHIFTHGLPPMGPLSDSTRVKSKPSSPTDAKHAKAELIEKVFVELSGIRPLPYPKTNMWRYVESHSGDLGGYSNEAGVNSFVERVFFDVLEAMGVRGQVTIRAEVELMGVRPDFKLLYVGGHPIGTIEGKQPGKIAMTDGNILGEVYDQLMHLHSMFGVDNPFAILTSYEEWRICWLDLKRSNEIATLDTLPKPHATAYHTPVKAQKEDKLADSFQGIRLKDEESPEPPATPSRTRDVGNLQSVDESKEEEKFVAGDDQKREFRGTEVFLWSNKSLPYLLASVVKKMMLARVVEEPSVLRFANATTSVWKQAPAKNTLRFDLCISTSVEWFYLWEHLGHGADGKAFLVSGGTKGAVGVLKMFFNNAEKSAEHEKDMWKAVYSRLPAVASVRVVQVRGHTSLLMPWFHSPTRDEATLTAIEATLTEDFKSKGRRHHDVAWRNVGVYTGGDGQTKAVVFDMKSVSADGNDEDWVTDAVASLRRKLE